MNQRSKVFRFARRVLSPCLLWLTVGCLGTEGGDGGCEDSHGSDPRFAGIRLQSSTMPCTRGRQVPLGTRPHLFVSIGCDGDTPPFLVAVSVDGKAHSVQQVSGSYGTKDVDLGSWEAADTTWHRVEVVIDPLNLFTESREDNNRGVDTVRVVAPDAAVIATLSGFVIPRDAGGDGYTRVTEVRTGTPVEAWLFVTYGGPYEAVIRSVRWLPGVDARDTLAVTPCIGYSDYSFTRFETRWTPPGPGTYDVEFRVESVGTVPDLPDNNVVTMRLTVTSASPAGAQSARVEGRP